MLSNLACFILLCVFFLRQASRPSEHGAFLTLSLNGNAIELFEPSVGLVPIGDRFTMGAKSAALACRKFFKFDKVIPIHYGTFPIIDANPDKFIAEATGQNVVVPKVGEAVEV